MATSTNAPMCGRGRVTGIKQPLLCFPLGRRRLYSKRKNAKLVSGSTATYCYCVQCMQSCQKPPPSDCKLGPRDLGWPDGDRSQLPSSLPPLQRLKQSCRAASSCGESSNARSTSSRAVALSVGDTGRRAPGGVSSTPNNAAGLSDGVDCTWAAAGRGGVWECWGGSVVWRMPSCLHRCARGD